MNGPSPEQPAQNELGSSRTLIEGQTRVFEMMLAGAELKETLDTICLLIEEQADDDWIATIMLVDEDGKHLRSAAGPSAPASWMAAIDPLAIGPSAGSCGTAAHRAEPVFVANVATNPLWEDFRDQALKHCFHACWSTPILSSDREVLGTFAIYRNVESLPNDHDRGVVDLLARTAGIAIERKRAEEKLRDQDRRKDEFLAMLAHELRNPLAPIRSGLDLMAMDPNRDDSETIEIMQEQIQHLVRLVDDLLDVSRIMRNRIELRKEVVSLQRIIQRSIDTMAPALRERQQVLRPILPQTTAYAFADPVRLVQAIVNLINNASKYSEVGSKIRVELEVDEMSAIIRISDHGVGIDPKYLPTVFDLFFQASQSLDRSRGGLGIGLTLVQRLVAMHGGEVSADSEGLGQGSTFTVRLPLTTRAESAALLPHGNASAVRRRILVVDDNRAARYMLSQILSRLGEHQIETATDGDTALAKVERFRPDVVFLDIGLPKIDGYQVARSIRNGSPSSDALLIALTGYGQEDDKQKALDAGFDVHLTKPTSVDLIQDVLTHPKLESVT